MNIVSKRKIVTISILVLISIAVLAVVYAYVRTLNKAELEFNIHINEQLVYQSAYGESPTFAIWLEDPATGKIQTIYVTNRAANNDWAGKPEVPVALPKWFEIAAEQRSERENQMRDEIIISGATPKPGYFTTRVNVSPGSEWICWIEMNLAGDYNETYKEYDPEARTHDEYGLGQPALLYRAEINADIGNTVEPKIVGMVLIDSQNNVVVEAPEGITTAKEVFDEIAIHVVKPKPKIIR